MTLNKVDDEAKRIVRPLLEAALAKGMKVGAEEETLFREESNGSFMECLDNFGDPLVKWIKEVVPEVQRVVFDFDYRLNTNDIRFDWNSGDQRRCSFEIEWKTKYPDHTVDAQTKRFDKTFKVVEGAKVKYELMPECRSCYALFASWEDLKAHLEAKPKHKMSFRPKIYNEIHPKASYGGWVKCHTCAVTPPSQRISGLESHYRNQPFHRRNGMIPRWKEDNHWWNADQPEHPEECISFPYTEKQLRARAKFEAVRGRIHGDRIRHL